MWLASLLAVVALVLPNPDSPDPVPAMPGDIVTVSVDLSGQEGNYFSVATPTDVEVLGEVFGDVRDLGPKRILPVTLMLPAEMGPGLHEVGTVEFGGEIYSLTVEVPQIGSIQVDPIGPREVVLDGPQDLIWMVRNHTNGPVELRPRVVASSDVSVDGPLFDISLAAGETDEVAVTVNASPSATPGRVSSVRFIVAGDGVQGRASRRVVVPHRSGFDQRFQRAPGYLSLGFGSEDPGNPAVAFQLRSHLDDGSLISMDWNRRNQDHARLASLHRITGPQFRAGYQHASGHVRFGEIRVSGFDAEPIRLFGQGATVGVQGPRGSVELAGLQPDMYGGGVISFRTRYASNRGTGRAIYTGGVLSQPGEAGSVGMHTILTRWESPTASRPWRWSTELGARYMDFTDDSDIGPQASGRIEYRGDRSTLSLRGLQMHRVRSVPGMDPSDRLEARISHEPFTGMRLFGGSAWSASGWSQDRKREILRYRAGIMLEPRDTRFTLTGVRHENTYSSQESVRTSVALEARREIRGVSFRTLAEHGVDDGFQEGARSFSALRSRASMGNRDHEFSVSHTWTQTEGISGRHNLRLQGYMTHGAYSYNGHLMTQTSAVTGQQWSTRFSVGREIRAGTTVTGGVDLPFHTTQPQFTLGFTQSIGIPLPRAEADGTEVAVRNLQSGEGIGDIPVEWGRREYRTGPTGSIRIPRRDIPLGTDPRIIALADSLVPAPGREVVSDEEYTIFVSTPGALSLRVVGGDQLSIPAEIRIMDEAGAVRTAITDMNGEAVIGDLSPSRHVVEVSPLSPWDEDYHITLSEVVIEAGVEVPLEVRLEAEEVRFDDPR